LLGHARALPEDDSSPGSLVTPEELVDQVKVQFKRRKFAVGLVLAIIDFYRKLDALGKFTSFEEFLAAHPRREKTGAGGTANTLIVEWGDRTLSLRPSFNKVQRLIRVEHKRFDFPNAPGHATQAWVNYPEWFDSILQYDEAEIRAVEEGVLQFVLEVLPSHEVDPSSLKPLARPFARLLEDFEPSCTGEKPGAVFQGMVFAYIRADAPHLFLEVAKVGAGSKRLQRVGDIDGWQGERLVITAEVKSYELDLRGAEGLGTFIGEASGRRALATIAALSFTDEAREFLEGEGVRVLDLDRLHSLVDLWDPLKQQAAFDAFEYYVHHVEKSGPISKRLAEFVEAEEGAEDESGA